MNARTSNLLRNYQDEDDIPLYILKTLLPSRKQKMRRCQDEDDIPLYIVKRKLHIRNMITIANHNERLETKKFNRSHVITQGCLRNAVKQRKIFIDESKNMVLYI